MKIPSSYRPSTDAADTRPAVAGNGPSKATASSATSTASTQVAFSATSSALQSESGDVNLERVEALREAIRRGELSIDAGRIADGLIESTRELLRGH